ncbi:MAG: hypothetical protein ABIG34_00900 [Candidatus Peregrinibacteria bacterium]
MPALAELPDGDEHSLPEGNGMVNVENLTPFMGDLHETIVANLLGGRRNFYEVINGKRVEFRLPQPQQLHDFVALHQEDSHSMGVVLKIPSTHPGPDGEHIYHTERFEYKRPEAGEQKLPDTSYLPLFSQN